MKIAIYKHRDTFRNLIEQKFFTRVYHNDMKQQLRGFRANGELEVYCFDGTDIDDILQNLITGFSRVALFEVNYAKIFKP